MHGAVDDEKRPVPTPEDVANFSKPGRADFGRSACNAIGAAHFLYRSRRDGEQLSADTEENDLFRLGWTRLPWSRQTHQRAPAGAVRQIPKTRFSNAA